MFWRKKVEVEQELQKLIELQGSESYKIWTDKIRKSICNLWLQLLQTDARNEKEIYLIATQMKQLYSVLKMAPNEELNLEDELTAIEKAEQEEIKRLRSREDRLGQRTGGAL